MSQGQEVMVRRFTFDKAQTRDNRYPFQEMNVGDTFTTASTESNRVKAAASTYGKRHGRKYRTRVVDAIVECTRVA